MGQFIDPSLAAGFSPHALTATTDAAQPLQAHRTWVELVCGVVRTAGSSQASRVEHDQALGEDAAAPGLDPAHPVLVHFYRAVVSHADVWRQRMDATTNWAAATTAAMVTFSFGDPAAPHAVLLLAMGFDAIFLLMESRRYQTYDLWRRRFRTLNQYFVAPLLSTGRGPDGQQIRENLALVADDLGRTVPHLRLADAVGYRIRRNYGYLLLVIVVAWLVKLEMHPASGADGATVLCRASVGVVPGWTVMLGVALLAFGALVLALRAPSERMLNWTAVPTPAERLLSGPRRWLRRRPGPEAER